MPRPRARRRATPARNEQSRTGRPVCDPVSLVGVDTAPKGDIPPGHRNPICRTSSPISAFCRNPSPGRVRPEKRSLSGAAASRSLSPKTVVCVYVHNCCAFSHERLTLVSPGLSNLFQRAPAYGTLYPCLTSIASSPSSQIGSMVYSATGKPWRPALPDDRSSTDAPPEHGSTSTTPCTRSTRLRQRGTGK